MRSIFNLIISLTILVIIIKFSKTTLSLDIKPTKNVLKLCDHGNSSCVNEILTQRFVIFNSEINQNITVKLGDLQSALPLHEKSELYNVKIFAERRGYLPPSNSNEIVINTICQFTYPSILMSHIDDNFCCRVELLIDSKSKSIPNPFSVCDLNLQLNEVHCFVPIKFAYSQYLNDKILPLIGIVYKKSPGHCNFQPKPEHIYQVSKGLGISFSSQLPVIWQPTDSQKFTILLGIPLYSVKDLENLLIPVRLVSDLVDLSNQIIRINCQLDSNILFHSVIANSPNESIIVNTNFQYDDWTSVDVKLKITPSLDQQLMFLNVTVKLDSRTKNSVKFIKVKCKIVPKNTKHITPLYNDASEVEISLRKSKDLIIIPVVKESRDIFSIYSKPNIDFKNDLLQLYMVQNYKDRSVKKISSQFQMYSVDPIHLSVHNNNNNKSHMSINMDYQTYLNPWSIQVVLHDNVHTLISPVRVWRPESWKLMLSDEILRPIKNWAVYQQDSEECVSRYKVARLKIMCRLFLIEETGEKRYIGTEDDDRNQIPYIDVTANTKLNQIKFYPEDIFSIEKSMNQEYFFITAKQAGKSSNIKLFSEYSQMSLTSIQISADQQYISVVDLIVNCIDVLSLVQQNRSAKSIHRPSDYKSITVSLTSMSPSKPCYLIVFLKFSDGSIERLSLVNITQYRLSLTNSDSDIFIGKITDNQLVTVRHMPHVNMSLYEDYSCNPTRLIFSKKIEWVTVEPSNDIIPNTLPLSSTLYTTISKHKTKSSLINEEAISSINLVHISIYICTGFVVCIFIGCVLFKLICYRNGHESNVEDGDGSTNYQRSASGFLEDPNLKVQVRSSNNKNFSVLGKCSTNCLRQNTNKTHNNEPYPPLLPPPGPIATNYDLTLSEPVCNESAVDSGIELGKLSSYSSNTCPSNDLCCTIDLYPSCSGTDDSLMHQPYQSGHFVNPMIGFYPGKGLHESEIQYQESMMLSSMNSTKNISNLRHPYW